MYFRLCIIYHIYHIYNYVSVLCIGLFSNVMLDGETESLTPSTSLAASIAAFESYMYACI